MSERRGVAAVGARRWRSIDEAVVGEEEALPQVTPKTVTAIVRGAFSVCIWESRGGMDSYMYM